MARDYWPGLWAKGRTVAIVCSGPSLSARQIHDVCKARFGTGVLVMAVNSAVYAAWFAHWLHACDYKWWLWNADQTQFFRGIKTTCADDVPDEWCPNLIRTTGLLGYDPTGLRDGGNGGYQAGHIAARAGARKIVYVGLDCGGGVSHFHGDHPDRIAPDWATIARNFDSLAAELPDGVDVVNCSPGTAVRAFRQSIDLAGELGL